MAELWELGAAELRGRIERREVSCREVAEAHVRRIEAVDPQVRAFITVTAESAVEHAEALDGAHSRGEKLPPLAGVPMALKDNLCTSGLRTTAGSKVLGGWKPPYDATAVALLREAGAVM